MTNGTSAAGRRARGLVLALAGAAVTAACGGAAKSEAPAASPAGGSSAMDPPAPATPASPPAQPAAAAGASMSEGPGAGGREATGKGPGGDIEAAQRELDVAAGDCVAACRALGAMDRATGRLCGAARETEDRGRCEDAKARVVRARDKVKSTCGACPGGVTVDRNAPVPTPGRP